MYFCPPQTTMNQQTININQYEQLFKQHYTKLCNAAHQITNDKEQAEDIVQDVFIKIWENKDAIQIKISSFSYLYRSVLNACYNEVKRKKVINLKHSTEIDLNNLSFSQNIDGNMDFSHLQNTIHKSLEKLPPKCKTIFVLSRFENYKYKEIAEMLDISIKTVEAQMGIAINRLNTELKPILAKHFPDLLILGIILSLIFKLL